jgi:hypothetical protein
MGISPRPPALTLLDKFLIETHAFGQDYIGNGVSILVVAVGLDGDYFSEGEVRGSLLRSLPERLASLRAVDSAETNLFTSEG